MSSPRPAFAISCIFLVVFALHAHSQTDVATQLIGTWRLVSWTDQLPDGTTRPNATSVGYLIYTADRMCAVLMDPNRPKWNDPRTPTGPEAMQALIGTVAYCSRYDVNPKEGFVIHHVEVDNRPNRVGTDAKRFFKFEGRNRLTLRGDPSELPGVARSTLVWERVGGEKSR